MTIWQKQTIHVRNAELFSYSTYHYYYHYYYLKFFITPPNVRFICVGRSRLRLRKGNTLKCFSTRRRPAGWGCWFLLVWRRPSSPWEHKKNVFNDVEFSDVLCSNKKVPHNCLGLFTAYNKERQRRFDLSFIIKPMSRLEEIMTSRERLWILEEQCCCPPEGLDLRDLFAALASDLVDILSCRPHHLLHPLLL